MNVIETNNLTKSYGKSRGIVDISFSVKEGEIFGFIGPNGSGKSTTIRILLSLIYPTSGSANIFGKDVVAYGSEIKKEIGYLPSEVFYYANMKVIELLKYSASFYKKDCSKRINYLAEIMHLDLNKKIDDLSFGNKKKVGIVQGLLHEPKLIILDEPTSGLDPLMQQKFFDLLKEENKKGATILFSSHILSEVQKLCDRVAIIKEGKIIKLENISALKENNYKRFRIETLSKIDKNHFNIMGVNKLEIKENRVKFIFKGNINIIIKKISFIEISNIWIDEPDLEEIFMHHYSKEA
ncbi:ABC transporter ATP-binding protein [Marinisporobacter balticus]|uniref:ABC-2 type transport system ATP-binding protein n=1 Tax=Marinisporobacter balticus TaxID=2018667 RepID=A0A4R2LAK8_9FIRM|nr:ABC transporter ATP-binding protein [Marinisporobacter balticus]TCO79808.1 ABC-2 type transport system ATP-binding protein [Marinisporobacter balticus]